MKPIARFLAFMATSVALGHSAAAADFNRDVATFLKTHCIKCHGVDKPEGELTLTGATADVTADGALNKWLAVSGKLKAGEMPPDGEPQPAPTAIAAVTEWIDAELAKAGHAGAVAASSLQTGNEVPHHLLFGPAAGKLPLDVPPRLWRISPSLYTASVAEVDRALAPKVSQPLSPAPGHGFKDMAAALTIDESTAAQLLRNAEVMADGRLGLNIPSKRPKYREFEPFTGEAPAPAAAQIETAIRKQYELVLKRAPTADEIAAQEKLFAVNLATADVLTAARQMLISVHMAPSMVYRYEQGDPAQGARRTLAPRELAFAIAFALTDKPPDGLLLKAADGGQLATNADALREAHRLLHEAKLDKPRLLRFFREYFGYAEAENVFKDSKDFQAHRAQALVQDTDRLILRILEQDRDVLRQLLTTTESFAHVGSSDATKKQIADMLAQWEETKKQNPQKRRPNVEEKQYFLSYNLPDFVAAAEQPTKLPSQQRAGILTQPSWLVAYSGNFDNHAIQRGRWVRERLLGLTVPDLPITVDAQLPEAPEKTLRERMEITKQNYCWQCHQKMNPLGLAFEQFDHFGRFRTEELSRPVDASGEITGTGDSQLDGPVTNAVELLHRLADSDRVRQVFVRHAFRYFTGRNENLGDAASLQAADKAYVESGGSFKALVAAILASDSFLVRTGG